MATSGYIDGQTNSAGMQVRVKWQQSDLNATNGTSVVQAAIQVYNSTATGQAGPGVWTLTVNGVTETITKSNISFYRSAGWVTVGGSTLTIQHDADGTKTVAISATGGFKADSGQAYTRTVLNDSAELDPVSVPTASTAKVTQTVAVNGSNQSVVTITRSNAAYTHTVRWYINSSYMHTQTGVGTSASYTIPTSWLAAMPTSTSITGHVTVTTFNGSTQIGSAQTYDFALTVPDTYKPTVASGWYSLAPVNTGLPALWSDLYVKGFSKVKATFDTSKVTAPTGTTIDFYKMTVAGSDYGSAASYTSGTLNTAGSQTVNVTVYDKRGRSAAASQAITVQDYSAPTLTIAYATRCLQDGTASSSGTYVKVKATANFSNVSGRNTATLKARSKVGSGAYGSYVTLTSGSETILSGFQATQSATVEFTVSDTVGNSSTQTRFLAAGEAPVTGPSLLGLNIRDGGTAAAFGKKADTDGWLQTNFTNGFQIVQGLLKLVSTTLSEAELKRIKSLGDNTGLDETAYGDANLITSSGMYHIQHAISNTPTTYGILLVIRTGVPWIVQIYVGIDSPNVYWRTSNGGTTWIGWRRVTSTAV